MLWCGFRLGWVELGIGLGWLVVGLGQILSLVKMVLGWYGAGLCWVLGLG